MWHMRYIVIGMFSEGVRGGGLMGGFERETRALCREESNVVKLFLNLEET